MKSIKSLENSPSGHGDRMVDVSAVAATVRKAVLDARNAVAGATRQCLRAGQVLLEAKAKLVRPRDGGRFVEQGDEGFDEWIRKNIPDISLETARRWMRAARNVAKALPPIADAAAKDADVIDVETVSISDIIATPDDQLSAGAMEWKQAWLDFTEEKTIKECLGAVCVEGDDAARVDRAVNGKLKGGTRGENRKDFPLFVLRKLKEASAHLAHWESMDANQRNEVITIFTGAVLGDYVSLHGRPAGKAHFDEPWPTEVCEALVTVLKLRIKG